MHHLPYNLICGAALLLLSVINAAFGEEALPKQVSLIGEFQKLGLTPLVQGTATFARCSPLRRWPSSRATAIPPAQRAGSRKNT
jgi:hypothetical protein